MSKIKLPITETINTYINIEADSIEEVLNLKNFEELIPNNCLIDIEKISKDLPINSSSLSSLYEKFPVNANISEEELFNIVNIANTIDVDNINKEDLTSLIKSINNLL
jgi:hypothetical protein